MSITVDYSCDMRYFGSNRVVSILEQARANVVRSVNNNMVVAYWLIGREIVQQIQGGDDRAEYGKQVIEQLSAELTRKSGRGFSTTNLRYFRTFYMVYSDRIPEIRHIGCGEFMPSEKRHTQSGVLDSMTLAVEQTDAVRGFSPNLGWSHYRTLMNVENQTANNSLLPKYMLYLPTEEELQRELEREQRLI